MLRLFGSSIHPTSSPNRLAVIDYPWNLELSAFSSIGLYSWIYALNRIAIGDKSCIGDCVKQVPRVLASQTLVDGNRIEIHVLADGELTEAERALICERCRLAVSVLRDKDIAVIQKQKLRTGSGGKTPLLITV